MEGGRGNNDVLQEPLMRKKTTAGGISTNLKAWGKTEESKFRKTGLKKGNRTRRTAAIAAFGGTKVKKNP